MIDLAGLGILDFTRNGSFSFDEMESKYYNFYAPSFEVICGLFSKTEIVKMEGMAITGLKVEKSLEKSDMCSFSVCNAYDMASSDFKKDWLEKHLAIGNFIEVKMGYGDRLESVFKGLITSVKFDFPSEGSPRLSVECHDKSYLMMKHKLSFAWHFLPSSAIAVILAAMYGLDFVVDVSVDIQETIQQENESNYSFLQRLANKIGYEFFISGDTLYFRIPYVGNLTPITTLKWGRSLKSFSPQFDLNEQACAVVTRGFSEKMDMAVMGLAGYVTVPGIDSQKIKNVMKNIFMGNVIDYEYDIGITSFFEAEAVALLKMGERLMKSLSGSGECIGLPELSPGRFIKIDGLGSQLNSTYYITAVTHTISESGYSTQFEVGKGNEDLFGAISNGIKKMSKASGSGSGMGGEGSVNKSGVSVGTVILNIDPMGLGRVRVKYSMREGADILMDDSGWARVAVPYAGAQFIPDIGDEVLVAFGEGALESPYVIGSLWSMKNRPPVIDPLNLKHLIKSKLGNTIMINDTPAQPNVSLETLTGQTIELQDAPPKITIKDKLGLNAVEIDGVTNAVTVKGNLKAELKSNACQVSLDSVKQSVKISGPLMVNLESTAQVSIKGAIVNIEAGQALNLKSGGVLMINGAIVKIN